MTGKRGKSWHQGTYARRAAAVRRFAWLNPHTRCQRCHRTHAEALAAGFTRAQAEWQAGHVNDGEVNGVLGPEHARCNASAGAAHGNRLREPRSQRWW